MNQSETKKNIMNIAAVVLLVVFVGAVYWLFFRDGAQITSSTANLEQNVAETVVLGGEVQRSIEELKSLQQAVAESAAIFNLPAFKNLESRSAVISSEPVSRENPFIVTDWKLKMKAIEEAAAKAK